MIVKLTYPFHPLSFLFPLVTYRFPFPSTVTSPLISTFHSLSPPPSSRDSTVINETCDVSPTNNVGCPTRLSSPQSFGPAFNAAGGGWYAIERSSEFIKVWFWSRSASEGEGGSEEEVPEDVKEEGDEIDTDTWGEPVAVFPGDECPIDEKFGAQNIAIGLTFCTSLHFFLFPSPSPPHLHLHPTSLFFLPHLCLHLSSSLPPLFPPSPPLP
ncbi:hypothetical protein NMY22_g13378 [Coprinellus aureogranulatus]|nr:hypothetical protein NMY22_g13378 [Coprinellus aureogranulatus]